MINIHKVDSSTIDSGWISTAQTYSQYNNVMTVPGTIMEGAIRYDPTLNDLMTYVNGEWQVLDLHIEIGTSLTQQDVNKWVLEQMNENAMITELCETMPALAEAKSQFELLLKMAAACESKE